jgi:beta-lactamase class A
MKRDRKWRGPAVLLGSAVMLAATPAAEAVAAATPNVSKSVGCTSATPASASLAKQMAAKITESLTNSRSTVGLFLTDDKTGVTCWYHSAWHFYAASVVKVTILAALLRKAEEQHRYLTSTETSQARLMITQSNNDAATALWNDVGFHFMQHFLNLAGMRHTELNHAWGLTQITAYDETLLLGLLSAPNSVLDKASRSYELNLMAHVIASQRWGVPAGAPADVTVHVKNGWLPYPGSVWEINSIGTFTAPRRTYRIAMLTYNNPSMAYGISTIENAAVVIHALLNPGKKASVLRSTPNRSWGTPDETIPRR